MIKPQVLKVETISPQRLDKYLVAVLAVVRTNITLLVQQRLILVNDVLATKPGTLIKTGDVLTILAPSTDDSKPWMTTPTKMDLKIIYEDQDLIAIHKPAGLLSLPTQHQETTTLLNGLIAYSQTQWTPLVVHRLDKDTSGIILFAKNPDMQQQLLQLFEQRHIIKKYYALVHHPLTEQHLMINVPIGRANDQSMKMIAGEAKLAKFASTEVLVVKQWAKYSLLEVILHTGRTHQIRVHLKYINHPIINDPLYSNLPPLNDEPQLLMAYYLSFKHPRSGQQIELKLPLEARFEKLIKQFEN